MPGIEDAYLALMQDVLLHGEDRSDRTGVGTRSLFGMQLRHDFRHGFPLLTTKKMHWRSIAHELQWMLRGETNVRPLQEAGVTIWDEWANADGDLGPVYGAQWRAWGSAGVNDPNDRVGDACAVIDQIAAVQRSLMDDPMSRRHIVSAWNVADLPGMALAPCHALFQFYVHTQPVAHGPLRGGPFGLSLHLYQRSADLFLGVPFNIAGYALLLELMARTLGYAPKELVISFGDVHVYRNHETVVREQLSRIPLPLPVLKFRAPRHSNVWEYSADDYFVDGYNSHSKLGAPVAV